jgi:hypothetical protein
VGKSRGGTKEAVCPNCGAVEMVDINCDGLESCGVCSILGANYVENHPDAFMPAIPQEKKPKFKIRSHREKKLSQSEQWKKRWGKYLGREVDSPTIQQQVETKKTCDECAHKDGSVCYEYCGDGEEVGHVTECSPGGTCKNWQGKTLPAKRRGAARGLRR